MTDKYGLIAEKKQVRQEQPELLPVLDLVRVRHQGKSLIVSRNAFGPAPFSENVAKMSANYCYPNTRRVITLRESTTSESISAAHYNFDRWAKPEIFDRNELQAGWVIKTLEGVYLNPPKDTDGKPIRDEKVLRSLRDRSLKLKDGVFVLENGRVRGVRDFGYASYESFAGGIQETGTFVEGGLARVLEHTFGKKAKKLWEIASNNDYTEVNVFGFGTSELGEAGEPIARVVRLYSGVKVSWLYINGGLSYGSGGCTLGTLVSTRGEHLFTQEKSRVAS